MSDDSDTKDRSGEPLPCEPLVHGHVCMRCDTSWFIYESECEGRCPDCGDYFVQ